MVFWDNIGVYDGSGAFRPAVSMLAYKDQLYIGTDNGVVLTFNTDRIKRTTAGNCPPRRTPTTAAHLLVLDHAVLTPWASPTA